MWKFGSHPQQLSLLHPLHYRFSTNLGNAVLCNTSALDCILGFFCRLFVCFVSAFSSVQSLSRVRLLATPWTAALKASLSITNCRSLLISCPLSWWCHPTILPSVIPFSSHLQSFPALGSFQISQFFTSGGQSIEVSASALVLPVNIQDWFPLGWTCWISLHSKGLSGVFSNITVKKHQFFNTQLSLSSNSHIHTWLLEKP